MKKGLVSVIMPTFNNNLTHLRMSIESVLAQTYQNLELLITDDFSTNTDIHRLLREYEEKDSRVKVFFSKKNGGPGTSRNNSIQMAEGQYIAFCDSDDRWMPEKLEKQLSFMKEKDCILCYASYLECNENDQITGLVAAPEKLTLGELKRDNKIGCLTAIYDTTPYGKFYMPTIRKRQDWALFLTIMKKCGKACGYQIPLAYYRICKNSVSRSKFSLLRYNARIYQEIFGYSILTSYLYLLFIFMPTYIYKICRNKLLYLINASKILKK